MSTNLPEDLGFLDGYTEDNWEAYTKGKTIAVLDSNGRSVIHWMGFDGSGFSLRTQKKNAKLIALAPQLLAEVKRLREELSRLKDPGAVLASMQRGTIAMPQRFIDEQKYSSKLEADLDSIGRENERLRKWKSAVEAARNELRFGDPEPFVKAWKQADNEFDNEDV